MAKREMETALQGTRVVEMTQALAGPYLAMLLGDLGADVVKVEQPRVGDQSRGWGPPFVGSESAYFMAVNRNKRSLTCDFKSEQGLEALGRLVDRADVVITNERRLSYRQRMGIDYAALSGRNPGVVYVSITGFGMDGPYEGMPGYDVIAQGMGGMMSLTGEIDGPPTRFPASIADLSTAMYALSAALAALLVRERTGRGQYIDASLFESQAALAVIQACGYLASGEEPQRLGNDHPTIVPFGSFKAKDGYLSIGCGSESLWQRLCALLGMEDIANAPDYATNRERVVRRQEVRRMLEDKLATRTVAEWWALLSEANIPSGPIYSVPQMLDDPQMRSRSFTVAQEHPAVGPLRTLACPVHLSDTPATYRLPAPLLGQHTRQILGELGYSAEEIGEIEVGGAV